MTDEQCLQFMNQLGVEVHIDVIIDVLVIYTAEEVDFLDESLKL